jgi:hypothetical protein
MGLDPAVPADKNSTYRKKTLEWPPALSVSFSQFLLISLCNRKIIQNA